jgi:putative hemolysin
MLTLIVIALFSLTATNFALRRFYRREPKKYQRSLGRIFFIRIIHHRVFAGYDFESVYFVVLCTQSMMRFLYAFFAVIVLYTLDLFSYSMPEAAWFIAITLFLLVAYIIIGELVPRLIGTRYPRQTLKYPAAIACPFVILLLPLSFPLLLIFKSFSRSNLTEHLSAPQMRVKQELIEMIREVDTGEALDHTDKELIESVVTFRNRIAREVMVPRVDIFSLPAKTSIKDAANQIIEEGYSRIPVYKNTVDDVIGILMYKDVLLEYMKFAANPKNSDILEAPIETIVKKTMYTPETKKISHLLQEFRKKQLHLAIVVDEYGGTEGIVTIEDILEEIVGEIADEYDEDTELYMPLASGSWLVDTKMNIIDLEEELSIKIPQDADYDTVGGYIYHRTGAIPSRGFVIDHDDFKIEVVKSNERGVERVKITPKKN